MAQLTLPAHAQVVIIGGGFAGASTAYFLTELGVRDVVVLEREATCGYHASGRNAALGRQLPSDERFADLAIKGAAFLRQPPAQFADEPLLSRCGSILVAGGRERLQELQSRARQRQLPHEVIAAAAVYERWPLLRDAPMAGGVYFPSDGVIDIHRLLQAYVAGARSGGARVVTRCEVTGASADGHAAALQTTRGVIRAGTVVNAAGAWAGWLGQWCGAQGMAFDPVRRHVHLTGPRPEVDSEAPFAWRLGADEFYVRPESGALLLSGCDQLTVEPCEPSADPSVLTELADRLSRVAPGLSELGIARSWACLRTFTRSASRHPVIAWDDTVPWLFWVAGLAGHGATSSSAVGQQAAIAIAARQ